MNQYKSFPEKTSNKGHRKLRSPRGRFSTEYRGFNTSITDMYRYPDMERVDCCSIACFGCIQADRNRYIVNGTKPPGLCRRICVHLMLPLCLFGITLFVAFNVPGTYSRNFNTTKVLLTLSFILHTIQRPLGEPDFVLRVALCNLNVFRFSV